MRVSADESAGALLQKSHKQISFMLKERQKMFEQAQAAANDHTSTCDKIPERFASNIDKHLQQYDNIAELVQLINGYSSLRLKGPQNAKFWELNMSIEREVEENLLELKKMDHAIDSIVNQEAESCTLQEEVEERIRQMLTNKEANYLSKAEPLLVRKTQCMDTLNTLRQQKNTIKQQKVNLIKRLLQQLEKLKEHRSKRVAYCRDRKLTAESTATLKQLLSDLNEVMSQRKAIQQNDASLRALSLSLHESNQRVESIGQELLAIFDQQQHMLSQIHELHSESGKSKYLEGQLLAKTSLESTDLMAFMDRSACFVREEEEKKRELEQILQAVSTTAETIKIFRHIHEAMESEHKRRTDLLLKLASLQKEQEAQAAVEDKMGEIEGELEKLEGKSQRLLKKQSSKVNQADFTAYKAINEELEQLETECRVKAIIINDMRSDLSKKVRQFLVESAAINEEYADIISEVMPQLWAKDLHFREENANQVKLYLSKMFNRLRN